MDSFTFTFISKDQIRNLGSYLDKIKYKYFYETKVI